MALYSRYVTFVDTLAGNDLNGSGSTMSAIFKNSSDTDGPISVTNSATGSTITRDDGLPFASSVTTLDTIYVGPPLDAVYHIQSISADLLRLTVRETPSSTPGISPWGIGRPFGTIARAAAKVVPMGLNGGADDHVYIKGNHSTTVMIDCPNRGTTSRALVFEGYATTPGDGGRIVLDTPATAKTAIRLAAHDIMLRNLKITNSGAVASWCGIAMSKSATTRGFADNCWVTPTTSATNGRGFGDLSTHGALFHCRADSQQGRTGNGIGIQGGGFARALFCVVHDTGRDGYGGSGRFEGLAFCIADMSGRNVAAPNVRIAGTTIFSVTLLFNTIYGASGSGIAISDVSNPEGHVVLGNIVASNAGFGLERLGITVARPVPFEMFNDFFANGLGPRNNVEEAATYDATQTDRTDDPEFTDAPNQDFTVGPHLKGALVVPLQVGGTVVTDIGTVHAANQ